jgi:hypothetical protein
MCQNPPSKFEVISPSTASGTIKVPILGYLTVKADKTDTTVKLDTTVNPGLSERQKATKRGN